MKIEEVGDIAPLVINQIVNIAISVGVAIYYYDGWSAVMYFFVSFAILNAMDAAFRWVASKFQKEQN